MTIWKPVACLVLFGAVAACTTVYQVPRPLTAEERAELAISPYSNLVVAVKETWGGDPLSYSQRDLVTLFKRSRLFKEVAFAGALDTPPDLIVELRSGPRPPLCATGEASTMIMTAGIVPLGSDNKTYSFVITNSAKSKALDLQFTYISKSYFGSISSLLGVSSDWSTRPQEERNYDLFTYELVARKSQILGLVDGKPAQQVDGADR